MHNKLKWLGENLRHKVQHIRPVQLKESLYSKSMQYSNSQCNHGPKLNSYEYYFEHTIRITISNTNGNYPYEYNYQQAGSSTK